MEFDADTFSGVARLFPLPNLVLYPHVMQPLHIFEERYREMLEDALAGDKLIAMAVLEPGWEDDYDSRPPVADTPAWAKSWRTIGWRTAATTCCCLGVERVRIVQELDPLRSFRQAKVEIVEDCYDFESIGRQASDCRRSCSPRFASILPCACQLPEQLEEMLSRHLPLGLLTDLAAYALPLDTDVKQSCWPSVASASGPRCCWSKFEQLAARRQCRQAARISRRCSATINAVSSCAGPFSGGACSARASSAAN